MIPDFLNFTNGNNARQSQELSEEQLTNHEECSDDRPSMDSFIPDLDSANPWDSVSQWEDSSIPVPDFSSSPENQSKESQQPQSQKDSAVLPQEYDTPQPEEKKEGGCGKRFDELESMLNALFEKVECFQVTVDKQQEIIKKQKRELERYQSDVIAKMKEPILLDLIEVMDAMDMTFDAVDKSNQKYEELYSGMDSVRKLMKATLENYRVFQIDDSMQSPTKLSRRQQVIDSRTSNSPEEFEIDGQQVNVYYERDRVGYVMETENVDGDSREIVLRPEDVVRVTYRSSQD